ncbi:unnamed protein product [Brachionus calyciflorus]|uniref:Nicotinamide riboside kinase 1 n=1 Tax=Brachionus calyciflorus TaxID=104777 RepID=A0A814NC90_9BILA|nr:unnamed protein product [Brachionus calyciflorus]
MQNKTKIIGISGCTNSGKTTLAKRLQTQLSNSIVLEQDDFYIRDENSLEYLEEAESYNFDVITAIDVKKMKNQLQSLIDSAKFEWILVEGCFIYDDSFLLEKMDRKYFLFIDKEESARRRKTRVYPTRDTQKYLEKCVWPEFTKYRERCERFYKDIIFIDASGTRDETFNKVYSDILNWSIKRENLFDSEVIQYDEYESNYFYRYFLAFSDLLNKLLSF